MQNPLIFRLFPYMPQYFHGIIRHGKNGPYASIVGVIPQAHLGNLIWVQDSCFDEAFWHSKGVF